MTKRLSYLRLLPAATILALASCASMGRPQGGPRDVDPPVFLGSNPAPGTTNFNKNKISLFFDENINIDNPTEKVVISPAQKTPPTITAMGKKLQVEIRDTLLPNTTYTLDFTNGISDLNEGNELDGFAIDFSTGDSIDSLQISGMVLQAANLEPAQNILVGVYSNLSDTAIKTLPFDRLTRTNQLGQFTIRNLKPGEYQIFALKDNNRDYHWDRSEDIAFINHTVSPQSKPTTVTDTLTASDGADSIVIRNTTLFTPNDILLTWFNENYKPQYMQKYERKQRHIIDLMMNAPSDTLPTLTLANGPHAGRSLADFTILNASQTLDTLQYWITDSSLIKQDSILLAARYLRTDSLEQLSWENDTLRLFIKSPKKKEDKKKQEKDKDKNATDSVPPITFLSFKPAVNSTLEVYADVYISASQPITSINKDAIHLEMLDDTIWTELETPAIVSPFPNKPLVYKALYDWEPGVKYRMTIDSAAVYGIYDQWNNTTKSDFTVRALDEYSTLDFEITGVEGNSVVEIVNNSDLPVAREKVVNGHAIFMHLLPATYYARLFTDTNGNGLYDDGSLTLNRLPEDVYYYPKKINVRKNWDIQQPWNVTETPIDQQKPNEIKKNKPKPKAGERNEKDNEEEDYDEFYDDPYNQFYQNGNPNDPFNNRKSNSTRRNNRVRTNNSSDRRIY